MAQPYVGEIRLFGLNFAPAGWAFCDGSLLPISENETLFQLIGTTYGGDGQSTFGLPDLRGRVPIHQGSGPGLPTYTLAETGGVENHTLLVGELPQHAHVLIPGTLAMTQRVKNAAGNSRTPIGNVPAIEAAGVTATYSTAVPDADMAAGAIGLTGAPTTNAAGSGGAHNNLQPYLVMNYCISLFGIFPSPT